MTRIAAAVTFRAEPSPKNLITAAIGARRVRFDQAGCCEHPLAQRVAQGVYALPPGFVDGYGVEYNALSFTFDSRAPSPRPRSGARLVLRGEQALVARAAWPHPATA